MIFNRLAAFLFIFNCFLYMSAQEKIQLTSIMEKDTFNAMNKLFDFTNIVHDGTLADVVDKTQNAWLRPKGIERWQMKECNFGIIRSILWPLFKEIGLIDEISPQYRTYDYCLILSSPVSRMRVRFAYALALWQQGVRFSKLIFLVGNRPLDPMIENEDVLYDFNNQYLPIKKEWSKPKNIPKTETDAAKMIFNQASLPKDFLEKVTVSFIDTQGKVSPQGIYARPTTSDSLIAWLKTKPQPGSVLSISRQPFVSFQHAVAKVILPKDFSLETVGKDADSSIKISIILDTIARWLYVENMYINNSTFSM